MHLLRDNKNEEGYHGLAGAANRGSGTLMAAAPGVPSPEPPEAWDTLQSLSRFPLGSGDGSMESIIDDVLLAWLLLPHRNNDHAVRGVAWAYRPEDAEPTPVVDHQLAREQISLADGGSVSAALQAIKTARLEALASSDIPAADGSVLVLNDMEPAPGERRQHKLNNSGTSSSSVTFQVQAITRERELTLRIRWRSSVLSSEDASSRLISFVEILTSILEAKDQDIAHAIGISTKDRAQVWSWNAVLPPLFDQCMHDVIRTQALTGPERIAIESWDGSFSYAEIDRLSDRLAWTLREAGAGDGTVIPLLFEKSKWTIVAVLAVMKSGAAFSLTDPSQPEARLRTIVEQTCANVIITSEKNADLGATVAPNCQVIVASSASISSTEGLQEGLHSLPAVPSSSPMYVIFTSGSTGKPKGVVISHANYTSGAIPRADAVGYRVHSRVFDFASYAFDVSIDCMLCTLACGGCLCIPTDEKRMNDLSGAIRDSRANMAHMTPSVARLLDPDIIPSLEVLGLGGEAVSAGDASEWSQHAKIVIAYGPSECTVGCTINNNLKESVNIGKGVGGVTWIVDPANHDRLMPVGSVGELLVEGPVVGIGYLNEPDKTAQVFIEDPVWLLEGDGERPGRRGRLYKTGDLVRYDPNGTGSIAFVGRKDQQVKLRGQRVELAEVEHHLRANLPAGVKIAAEVITPSGNEPTLVAFLSENNTPIEGNSPIEDILIDSSMSLSIELSGAISRIEETLGAQVPRYMVPTAFIPLPEIPALVSGKIDRKRLRNFGSSITREQISRLRVDADKRAPQSDMEKALHGLWARVLGFSGELSVGESFFALGGDSLKAMRLVSAAREQGIDLSVATIFQQPTLKAMALAAEKVSGEEWVAVSPFSLLGKDWEPKTAQSDVAKLCGVQESLVEDVYPCTPLQEGLMALSAKVKEAYVAQRVVELDDLATADRLHEAFNAAAQDSPILRTRIVQVPGQGLVQVVVRESIQWHHGDNLESYLVQDRLESMELGKPLVRCATIQDGSQVHFVLTMHHALYDGWSMPLVVDRINKAYRSVTASKTADFRDFIKYLSSIDRKMSDEYWRDHLAGAVGPQFPPLPWEGYQAQADSLLEHYVALPPRQGVNTTVATVIRGAWALLASQYTASTDVVFGETLTGRNAPIHGAGEIEGPMITTVPARVRVNPDTNLGDYLQEIHDQGVGQIPYEHVGLQHIRRLSPDALQACELRAGLVLHPSTDPNAAPDPDADLPASRLVPAGDAEAAQEALKFNTYPLMLVCSLDPNGFLIMASFDSKCADKAVMEGVLAQLGHAAQQLCGQPERRLADIELPVDVEELHHVSKLSVSHLGKEFEAATAGWIVHPNDDERLLPIGAVGELFVLSSTPLQLDTVVQPKWLQSFEATSLGGSLDGNLRLYRTERLAKFNHDGFVTFVEKAQSLAGLSRRRADRTLATSNAKQRRLRSLWSRVLRLPEEEIGLDDSFFRLGGDSIAAMKLVSEARLGGLNLSVAQIFQSRSLFEMARVAQALETEAESVKIAEPATPFALLDVQDSAEFITRHVTPQLADLSWKVVDVVPTRPLQEVAVRGSVQQPRFSIRYEAMYFSGEVDRARLFKSCQEMVTRNEILRTVFVDVGSTCYGVVIDDIKVPVDEYEVSGDLEQFTRSLCNVDIHSRMALGSSFVKFFFVQAADGTSCLVFRLSHAQYDEICLPLCLKQLSALYEGRTVQNTLPFSSFVNHVVKENIPRSIAYWRGLLEDSAMSIVRPSTPITASRHFAIHQTFDISTRSKDVTIATLPTAAWALCLARRLATRDVLFGEVVSGRNIDFPGADNVMGPCWQYVPVRVKFAPGWTGADLLAHVEHQHIASSAHEGIGLREIAEKCADWQPGTVNWFDTVVHQDVEHVENLDFFGARGRMETIYPHEEPLREWKLQAFVGAGGDTMALEIVTVESWRGHAIELLEEVGTALELLVHQPGEPLFEEEDDMSTQASTGEDVVAI